MLFLVLREINWDKILGFRTVELRVGFVLAAIFVIVTVLVELGNLVNWVVDFSTELGVGSQFLIRIEEP